LLQRYQNIITRFTPRSKSNKPLVVVISGNRLPYKVMQQQQERYAVLDGRLEDLGIHTQAHVMPFISDNWHHHFRWRGEGDMPKAECERLQRIVSTAHQHGQKVRFWGTPDEAGKARDQLWQTLLGCSVDLINTDDVAGLKTFLTSKDFK
jgi:hypothetical protein